MARQSNNLSIKTKLQLILGIVAASAVALACLAFGYQGITTIEASTVRHLTAVGDVVGANTIAAITFDRPDDANHVLSSLRLQPAVRYACVFENDGKLFASFQSPSIEKVFPPPNFGKDGHKFTDNGTLEIRLPINDEGERIGTLYLQAGMEHVHAELNKHIQMAVIVAVTSLAASMLLASQLQNLVSFPIRRLAEATDKISKDRSYSLRVTKLSDDEIGSLYDAFNRMLTEIEAGQKELQDAHDKLESRVRERTAELSSTNRELNREIATRKRAEEEIHALEAKNIDNARRVGMAEIATSVLHNVGNVLNSVNVSTTVIADKLRNLGTSDFARAVDLVEEHRHDLTSFVNDDAHGKHLPNFLAGLSQHMLAEEKKLLEEIDSLATNIEHIKTIIAVQQSNAGLSGMVENVFLSEIIDDAIQINAASMSRHEITVNRQIDETPILPLEKQRMIQILVNLIANAKYAIISSDRPAGEITVAARHVDDVVRIQVIDNGIGISEENITRIFSYGFTTRKEGHGFGLHSGALAAKEMGCELTAYSDGLGQGATFTLDIPCLTTKVTPCPLEMT